VPQIRCPNKNCRRRHWCCLSHYEWSSTGPIINSLRKPTDPSQHFKRQKKWARGRVFVAICSAQHFRARPRDLSMCRLSSRNGEMQSPVYRSSLDHASDTSRETSCLHWLTCIRSLMQGNSEILATSLFLVPVLVAIFTWRDIGQGCK